MKYDYKIIIGIDPGSNTGFAVWNVTSQKLTEVSTLSIHAALDRVKELQELGKVFVRYEDASKRTWFGKFSPDTDRARLQGAGSIKRDCAIWKEFLNDYMIDHEPVAPRHIRTKMKSEPFNQLTGWQGRTTSHGRDAAMMVFKFG